MILSLPLYMFVVDDDALRCTKRFSLCSAVSCSRLPLRWRRISSRRSRPRRSFGGKSSSARICSHLWLLFCVICMGNCSWYTNPVNTVSQTINTARKPKKASWRHATPDVRVDTRDIFRDKGNRFCSWPSPRDVNALRARRDYNLASLTVFDRSLRENKLPFSW